MLLKISISSEAVAANHILWCVAQTFGSTSPNNTRKKVTTTTLMRNSKMPCNPSVVTHVFIKVFDISTIPIFTKQLAISIEASSVLGVSSRVTIRLKEGCCLVLSILISLSVSEKNAIWEPATKKEIKKRIMTVKKRMVVAAGVIAKNKSICWHNKFTEW